MCCRLWHPSTQASALKSYRDVSRVARINAEMWAQLFIDNKEPLIREIDDLVGNLQKFRSAIEAGMRRNCGR